MLAGVDAIQSRTYHGNGGPSSLQRAFVGGTIHPQGQSGNHADTSLTQGFCELTGVFLSLRGRVAAADDGQPPGVAQGLQVTQHLEHDRWIGNLQQLGGIAGVAQGQDVPLAGGQGEPCQVSFQGVCQFRRLLGKCTRHLGAGHVGQPCRRL